MNTIEMLDLVDEDDTILDTLSRDEIYAKNLKYVRVVEGFIKNSKGQLWIPVRGSHKRIAPGGFDVGVGGHVEHGESYIEAFRKETIEELGWNIDEISYREIGKFGPRDGLLTVSMIYEITSEVAPHLNPEDFVSADWLTPQEVVDRIKSGHPSKLNLLPLLKLTYKVS